MARIARIVAPDTQDLTKRGGELSNIKMRNPPVWTNEMIKIFYDEILGEPKLRNSEFQALNEILTKILCESDQETRAELRIFLMRWKARTIFVDALKEEKDRQDDLEIEEQNGDGIGEGEYRVTS